MDWTGLQGLQLKNKVGQIFTSSSETVSIPIVAN